MEPADPPPEMWAVVPTEENRRVSEESLDRNQMARMVLGRDSIFKDRYNDEENNLGPKEPMSDTGKRQQQVKIIVLVLLPFATLLSVAIYMNTDSIFAMKEAAQTKSTIEFSVFVGRLIVILQQELDQSVLHLSSIGPETKFFLAQTYTETDLYLNELPYWPTGLDRSDRKFFNSKDDFRRYLKQHRDELSTNISVYDEILFYKESIDVFLIWLYDALKESKFSSLWKALVAYQKVIFCVHYAGIERSLGTTYFVEGGFSDPYLYKKYNEVVFVFNNNFAAAMKYSPLVKPIEQYTPLVNGENLTDIMARYRDQIQFQNITAPSIADAAAWFDFMSTYLDVLFNFQTKLAEDIKKMLNERAERVLTDVASSSLVMCIVIIILPLTVRALYNLTNDIQSYAVSLAIKTIELNQEKRKTDSLLHQMLPQAVADRLKNRRGGLAEYFREVTVFFSDIPGFTTMASDLSPMDLVRMLNHIYTTFDTSIEKYDVYKVETIGDSYMVASGLPWPNGHRHAIAIAFMSLELMDVANELHFSDIDIPIDKISLRVGIHTGPVVAGVVGMRLPRYCLFGDTVNTASRMESHGEATKIHVSAATRNMLIRHDSGFILECRGKVNCKGKGKVVSYWLHGHRSNMNFQMDNIDLEDVKDAKNTVEIGVSTYRCKVGVVSLHPSSDHQEHEEGHDGEVHVVEEQAKESESPTLASGNPKINITNVHGDGPSTLKQVTAVENVSKESGVPVLSAGKRSSVPGMAELKGRAMEHIESIVSKARLRKT